MAVWAYSISMNAPSQVELTQVSGAGTKQRPEDYVVHWHSSFGLVVIEVRQGQVFVNGDLVRPAATPPAGSTTADSAR
jgi:hypothetical protein